MSSLSSITQDFPVTEESVWTDLVERALKGKGPDALASRTEHGVPVRALYRRGDGENAGVASGLPGSAPFTRGGQPGRDAWLPWDIRQMVRQPDCQAARQEIFENLTNGVTSIELRVDPEGENGVGVNTFDDLVTLLDGVELDLAPVSLDLIGVGVGQERHLAAMLAAAVGEAYREKARLAFNLDPVGAFARTGAIAGGATSALTTSAADSRALLDLFPKAHCMRADARLVHEAGGTEVQELAYLAATASAYIRAGMEAGLTADAAVNSLLATIAVGSDYHVELPKLRAARKILGRIAQAFGANSCPEIHAVTSRRMLAARDPWNNLLRTTAACFAAGVGGADAITVRTFTDAIGHAGRLARRMARNTQLIAQEESGLGQVIDPAGGSAAFEQLTQEIAEAGWGLFQEIEKEGGILASLTAGKFQAGVSEARQARRAAVAKRREWVTGVSDFPKIEDDPPEVLPTPAARSASAAGSTAEFPAHDSLWSDIMKAASSGASLLEASLRETDGDECEAMWPIRLAEPYEALRDVADARRAAGHAPKVFLAALGPLAEHSARLTYATNFFAAGGIEAVAEATDPTGLANAFAASGCQIVCLCGSDPRYAEDAVAAAEALRGAGAGRIYLAGKPGDTESQLREAGIDEFIHIGVDVVASLELAHAELGLGKSAS